MFKLKKNAFIIAFLLFALVFIMLYSYNKLYFESESFENDVPEFGIVILRHVNNKDANRVWIKCLEQVRKYYPIEPVVIIDDNSNYEYIQTEGVNLSNCIVIDSEIKKAGEALPYYYFYKNKWFDKMLFIHDSVFIESRIEYKDIATIKALWHFNTPDNDESQNIFELLPNINYADELINLYNEQSQWKGIYGVMCIIDHKYLVHIMEKYNIEKMIPFVDSRQKRMACERIFGLIASHDDPRFVNNPSIFGNYEHSFNNRNAGNYNYDYYMQDVNEGKMKVPINKLSFGR